MPKATPEEIKQNVKDEVDKLHNHEYETDPEVAEIKARVGVETDEVDPDSIAQLAARADEIGKQMDELIEQTKEAGTIPGQETEDPLKDAHFGSIMAEMRNATHYGQAGPILSDMDEKDWKKNGLKLPDRFKSIFDGKRQKTTGFLEEGQGSLGGFTVPEQFVPTLLMLPLLEPIVRGRAFTIRGTSNVAKVPRIHESSRASNVHGGVTGNWTAEGASISVSNPAFGQAVLMAKKLALLTYASNELLDDNAVGLNDVLVRIFSDALNWFEDKAFIDGSGVNEPLGLRNAPCKDSVTTTASQFYIVDACKLFANLLPGSERNAIWLMNPSLREELPQMLSVGGSATENIWYPKSLSIKDAPDPWRLLGMPIFWTEHLEALGTDEDVMLVDLSYYLLLERQDIRAAVSTDARFANDETGYRLTLRSDGQPWPSSTLTLADGSTTVSPVVANDHT
jgi:HK97 family phage major capsid protein